ncbi:transferase [Kitasatospora sp. NPDC093550]|uniref:transferase n=1 Tax=Kitasatospora sp. NPDC093550 TaxID=3364089 RepID=UPI0038212582
MSSRLRFLARALTGLTAALAYVAAHLLVSAAAGEQVRRNLTLALWFGGPALVLLWPTLRLRARRRAEVAELVRTVSQFVPPRLPWQRALRLLNVLGLVLFGGGTVAVDASERNGHKMPLEAQALLLLAGLAALVAGVLILRRTRRYAARPAARALLDGRRPVLYLRSFGDDASAAEVEDGADVNLHTREEQFAGALGAVGPVIAVGRPGEPMPQLGAARFYLPADDWKPTVRRLMDLSQLIVLRLGQGDGLWWEAEQVQTTQPPAKLVLLLPPDPSELTARLNAHIPQPVPPVAPGGDGHWISAAVVFDEYWRPQVFPVGLRRAGWRGWSQRAALGSVDTPTAEVARAVGAALASSGGRRRRMVRRMVWRARLATQAAALAGLGLAVTLVLAGWLGYRVLQLIGTW